MRSSNLPCERRLRNPVLTPGYGPFERVSEQGTIIKKPPANYPCMDCPRCSETLETYALSGHEAEVCEACGYAGVAVSHESEPIEVESWQDALQRFKEN